MSATLQSRVHRLELGRSRKAARLVVVFHRNEADKLSQLTAVEAAIGPLDNADLVVCIRKLGGSPSSPPTVDGKEVPWA